MMQYLYNGWQQENKPDQNLISRILLVTLDFPSHSASYIAWLYVCIVSILSPTLQISPEMTSWVYFIFINISWCGVVWLVLSKPEDFY